MRPIICVALLSMMGCASTPINTNNHTYTSLPPNNPPVKLINVWIDPRFSAEDKVSIARSVSEWNYVLNGHILLAIQDQPRESGWQIIYKPFSDLPVNSNDLAWVDNIGGSKLFIVRERFVTQRALFEGTLHEIGHLLGLVHNDIPGQRYGKGLSSGRFSLMEYQCVDEVAAYQVALWNKLPVEKMNWCTIERKEEDK